MNAAETTPEMMTASDTCTMSAFCAWGTYTPSTLPVAIGTSDPSATVTSPASTRFRRSPLVPNRPKRSSCLLFNGFSGSGR